MIEFFFVFHVEIVISVNKISTVMNLKIQHSDRYATDKKKLALILGNGGPSRCVYLFEIDLSSFLRVQRRVMVAIYVFNTIPILCVF